MRLSGRMWIDQLAREWNTTKRAGFCRFRAEVLGPIRVAAAPRCDQVGGRSQPEFAELVVAAHGNATKRAAKIG
jgi:hypothetical protein